MKEKPRRLSVEDYQRLITFFVATRGTCDRLRVATTLWDKKGRMISCGYNGSLPGDVHCDDVGHLIVENHCVRTNHGEENAILNAGDLRRLKAATARTIGTPCYNCAKKLITVGVKKIEFIGDYENALGGTEIENLCAGHKVELVCAKDFDFLKVFNQAINFLQGPGGPLKDLPKMKLYSLERAYDILEKTMQEKSLDRARGTEEAK